MKYLYNIYLLLLISLLTGCRDDFDVPNIVDTDNIPTVEAFLSLNVNGFSVSTDNTRGLSTIKEETTEAENRIENIWIFQFKESDGSKLITPIYKVIDNKEDLNDLVNGRLKVDFATNTKSRICVVANISNETWGNSITTYNEYLKSNIPNLEPVYESELTTLELGKRRSLAMEGEVEATVGEYAAVNINLTRLYAKLKISFGDLGISTDNELSIVRPKSIEINNIPNFCSIRYVPEDYSTVTFVTRTFNPVEGIDAYVPEMDEDIDPAKKEYIIYLPENLQGNMKTSEDGNKIIPEKATKVTLTMINGTKVSGMDNAFFWEDLKYTCYVGKNTTDNFDIIRNNVYRLKTIIYDVTEHSPSSNCFVVTPGKGLMFEPYYRVETGGKDGSLDDKIFEFSNYLDPNDKDESDISNDGKKVIQHVQILWQTEHAIGDNSNGNLVKFIKDEKDPYHSKIYVKTNQEGNALIGAFNKDNEIIWSWHIWITDKDPANVANAVVYSTYRWDKDKIYSFEQGITDGTTYKREPGYAIMPCNLGALDLVPQTMDQNQFSTKIARTHGMLYQWGRKDPFPPNIKYEDTNSAPYNYNYAGYHYNYKDKKDDLTTNLLSKTSAIGSPEDNSTWQDPKVSFYSFTGYNQDEFSTTENAIRYSIKNPLVYLLGTKKAELSVGVMQSTNDYFADGDWLIEHNDKLWGGLDPATTPGIVRHIINVNKNINIFNNYGDKKTIFDPCPSGWRVPPGDLWLGFTKSGKNPGALGNVNYDSSKGVKYGMYMYMNSSRWDTNDDQVEKNTLYFPAQGPRVSDGRIRKGGVCGNYHGATADLNNRINALHIHGADMTFKVFEEATWYTVKSVGAAIRCVRDTK